MKTEQHCGAPNHSIACTVEQCTHHCGRDNYCSLNQILVGTHKHNPTKSFQKR